MNIYNFRQHSVNIQRGYNLIELMISITIGMIISAAVLSIFVSVIKSDSDNLKSIRINQDIRAAMGLIIRDLRRAGYNSGAATDILTGPVTPFQNLSIDTANSCLNYSYDVDQNGALANESFGFKLAAGAIQSSADTTNCSANGTWLNLTDQFLTNISVFNVSDPDTDGDGNPGITSDGVTTHQVTISITANLIRDTTVVRTITEIVEVRNVEI